MPSSRSVTIPQVIAVVQQLQPESILDIGVGFGKWGYLFREYTDIVQSELDPDRYRKPGWKVRIDGIEGFPQYLHEGHHFIYDKIHVGDAAAILPQLGKYDVIFLGDIIEHFDLRAGTHLLKMALERARVCVLLTTPRFETNQGGLCGNPLETHRSLWGLPQFHAVGKCLIALADRKTYVVMYPKPQTRAEQITFTSFGSAERAFEPLRKVARRFKRAARALITAFHAAF